MSESNERWLLDGDCEKCRRKLYCSNVCRAHKVAISNQVANLITDSTMGAFGRCGANPNRDVMLGVSKAALTTLKLY